MKRVVFVLLIHFKLIASGFVLLEPSAAEIILALNAKDKIVAISMPSRLAIYPYEVSKTIQSVGSYIKPSIEKIVSLKPELVIAGHHSSSVARDLEVFGIKTLIIESNTLKDMKENIKKLSILVGKEREAEIILSNFEKEIEALKDSRLKNKKVLFISSLNPMIVFCSNNLADNLIKEFDMVNICDKKEKTLIVNIEYILSKNADFIVYTGDEDLIFYNKLLKHTNAYKNNKILKISSSKLLRASPRIILTLKELKDGFLDK